jgi:RHS repeat-associated protein
MTSREWWAAKSRQGLTALLVLVLAAALAPLGLINQRAALLLGLVGSYEDAGGGSYYCTCLQYAGSGSMGAGDPVELWRGALQWSQTDLAVGGAVPMRLSRFHCTRDYTPGPFGTGTSMAYDAFIISRGAGYELITPKNEHAVFDVPGPGYWTNGDDPEYAGYKLAVAAGSYQGTLTAPDGSVMSFGPRGGLIAVRDRLGNGLIFTRNSSGYLTSITNSANSHAINITYGGNGLVENATETATGRTVRYAYNASNCLATVTDVAGGVTTYNWGDYNYGWLLSSVTDPRGVRLLANTYDSEGRVVSQQLGNNGAYQFAYLPQGDGTQVTQVTDPNGNVTGYHLERSGFYSYHPKAVTSALGRTTRFDYAASGISFLAAVTDFRNRTVAFDRDEIGRVLAVHQPTLNGSTATTSFTYDPQFDAVTSVTSPLNLRTQISLNGQGLPETLTGPTGATVQVAYNAQGQPTQVTTATGGTYTTEYDAAGRPVRSTNPLNESRTAQYDAAGRLQQVTDALGRTISYGITSFSRLASVSGPAGSGYSLTRNAANYVTELRVNSGAVHRWSYDGAGNPVSGIDPAGDTETVQRDANGNAVVTTDRNGQRTETTLGPGDRTEQVIYRRADGTVESTLAYHYDPATDLLARIEDSAGPGYSFQYNALDQPVSMSGPEGVTTWSHDNLGRLISAQAPGQEALQYVYDSYGRLAAVSQGDQTVAYSYDSAGRLSSIQRPNGVVTTYFFDALSRVSRIEHRRNGSLLEYEAYTRDAGGRVTARERNGQGSTFSHDNLDQLTGYSIPGQSASLAYDGAGNRTGQTVDGASKSLTYTVANRLASDGGTAVSHDANGNVTRYGSAVLSWDARGRLLQVQDGTTTSTFEYDCFNRRVSKTVNGVTKRYVYLGADLAAETDAQGSVTASYFYQPGVDLPVSRTDNSGTVYYLQDHAGSVTALTRPDGTLIGRYAYTPFGEVSADAGMPQQPLLWTARERDETGLYYLRGRYYSAAGGRFLSEDPAGLSANLNLYLFALNSPVGMRDPFGLDASNLDDDADGDIWGLIGDYKKATGAFFDAAGGLLEGATKGLYGGPGGIAATVFDAGNAAGKGDLVGVAAAVGPDAVGHGVGAAAGSLDELAGAAGKADELFDRQPVAGKNGQLELPFDDLPPRQIPDHKHHITPMYLGGDPDGPLGVWPADTHYEFHDELDEVFPRTAPKGTYDGLDPALRDEILNELYKHYPDFKKRL